MLNSLSILPLSPSDLEAAIATATAGGQAQGLSQEEVHLQLEQDFDRWLEQWPPKALPANIAAIVEQAKWAINTAQKARAYSDLVAKISSRFGMSRREAAIVLSQIPLILQMASEFRASSARLALLVSQVERRIPVGWRLIEAVLLHFKHGTSLDRSSVVEVLTADRCRAETDLGDSTLESALATLISLSVKLGLGGQFRQGIQGLFLPPLGYPPVPYLQVLLYICTIDPFFDHPPEYLYAFKPRGDLAEFIFGTFPPELAPGGNPMLNNFKAVDRLTTDWAESRADNLEQARAFVEVVMALSSLAYSPRVQISSAIRALIFRFITLHTPASAVIPHQTDFIVIKHFLEKVASEETYTRGVIEQRTVDFLASFKYKAPDWRGRGLGDPINATNSSSKKLGDCDFQNIATCQCAAFEAHAGKLTDVYLEDHLRTLRLNLPSRIKDWSEISEVNEWTTEIHFLAHTNACKSINQPPEPTIKSLSVHTYSDYLAANLAALEGDPQTGIKLFNEWVIDKLNANNTPVATRLKALELLQQP